MDRLNGMGILRRDLPVALKDHKSVFSARKIDSCLLCRRPRVLECGLCDVCYGGLEGEELVLAHKWFTGESP